MHLSPIEPVVSNNHWLSFLPKRDRSMKIFMLSDFFRPSQAFVLGRYVDVVESLMKTIDTEDGFGPCIITFMGFEIKPVGLLRRGIFEKKFDINIFEQPSFYVVPEFDEKMDQFEYGQPVALVEGILDAETLTYMTGYPFVMAYSSGRVPESTCHLLASMTDRVVILPDNDTAGNSGFNASKRTLESLGVHVERLNPPSGKDMYDYYATSNDLDKQIFSNLFNLSLLKA